MSPRRFNVSVVVLLAVAALLRWINLSSWDMWTDEVQTLWTAQSGYFIEGPMYVTAPINFFLTMVSVRVFGADEFGLRFFPFVFGVLTVGVFAWFARDWIGDRAALIGAALLTIDPWHVGWSQTGRHFALQTLLLLCATHFLHKGWIGRRPAHLWLSAGFAALALFTHSSSMFYVSGFIAFFGIGWLQARFRVAVRPAADYMRGAIPFLLIMMVYLPIFFGVARYLLGNKEAWNPPWNIIGSLEFYLSPYLIFGGVAGALLLWRERRDLWLLLSLVIGLPVLLVTAASSVTIASAAYCLAVLPLLLALVAKTADWILDVARDRGVFLAGAALVLGLILARGSDLAHYYLVYNGFKPRWHEVTEYVTDRMQPGDTFYAAEGDVPQYYLGRGEARWVDLELVQSPLEPGAWYAVYVSGGPFPGDVTETYRRLSDWAELKEIFPLHYGAKDRTIAVFRAPVD